MKLIQTEILIRFQEQSIVLVHNFVYYLPMQQECRELYKAHYRDQKRSTRSEKCQNQFLFLRVSFFIIIWANCSSKVKSPYQWSIAEKHNCRLHDENWNIQKYINFAFFIEWSNTWSLFLAPFLKEEPWKANYDTRGPNETDGLLDVILA